MGSRNSQDGLVSLSVSDSQSATSELLCGHSGISVVGSRSSATLRRSAVHCVGVFNAPQRATAKHTTSARTNILAAAYCALPLLEFSRHLRSELTKKSYLIGEYKKIPWPLYIQQSVKRGDERRALVLCDFLFDFANFGTERHLETLFCSFVSKLFVRHARIPSRDRNY